MSNLSGLPPASVIRAATIAVIQDVAVRLINMPDSLQSNPQPLKLTGKVIGQNQDGSVKLETERGIITMLMKDKGSLPVGQSVEIEIPSGRPPQQAVIRPQAAAPPAPATPSPAATTSPTLAATISSSLKLDRYQNVKADDIAEAVAKAPPESDPRLSAPLQAGQIIRLTPLPPGVLANAVTSMPADFSPEKLFTALLNMIGQATELPIEIRRNLVQILGTVDISTFLPPAEGNVQAEPEVQLHAAFQKLVQALDLPETVKLQNAPLQNMPATILNSGRALDVKILAFQSGNFQAALTQAQSVPGGPLLTPENFIVVATPVSAGPTLPAPPVAAPLPPSSPPVTAPVPQGQISATTPAPLTIPAAPPPPAMLGQVTGFTPQGQPIVSLALPGSPQPREYVAQFVANNVITGAPVIVSPLPAPVPGANASFVPFAIGQSMPLANWAQPEIWDSLQTLLGTITHINPALGQAMAQMIPNSAQPQNMGALSLFFLSVMRSGDLDTWISQPAINLLRAGNRLDPLRQLAGDAAVSNRLETATLPNDWRATVMPFLHDQQVHKLPLFYKQWKDDGDNGEQARKEDRMRFLFNLKLSRMGDVQVDGFMQREKLDMILRTKAIISTNMQQALKMTYTKAMERSNLSGEITFQFKPEQWVHVEMAG